MTTARHRWLTAFAAALTLGGFACSERPRDAIDTATDTMTTPAMRQDLTNDLRAAELALKRLQDSVDAALGPDLAVRLQPLREVFVTYKKEQCERLKEVFKEGTFGAVTELECLIHLTDSRREFVEEHYDFIDRIGGRGARSGVRTPNPGHERLKKALR
jgi:hypothetical protein